MKKMTLDVKITLVGLLILSFVSGLCFSMLLNDTTNVKAVTRMQDLHIEGKTVAKNLHYAFPDLTGTPYIDMTVHTDGYIAVTYGFNKVKYDPNVIVKMPKLIYDNNFYYLKETYDSYFRGNNTKFVKANTEDGLASYGFECNEVMDNVSYDHFTFIPQQIEKENISTIIEIRHPDIETIKIDVSEYLEPSLRDVYHYDVNHDNKIDIMDLIDLKRFLLGGQ